MSKKLKRLAACGLLLWVASSAAQAQAPGLQGRLGGAGLFPDGVEFSVTPTFIQQSLEELIANSMLIVEVTVVSAFPTSGGVEGSGPRPSTDFVVAPQRILKGQFAADRFVVNQLGGQVEERIAGRSKIYTFTYYTSAHPGGLMRPGQRYVLFLRDPARSDPERPQRDALQRFEMSFGVPSVVRVEQDKVELSSSLPFRDSYGEKSAAQFMDEIATKAPLIGPGVRRYPLPQ